MASRTRREAVSPRGKPRESARTIKQTGSKHDTHDESPRPTRSLRSTAASPSPRQSGRAKGPTSASPAAETYVVKKNPLVCRGFVPALDPGGLEDNSRDVVRSGRSEAKATPNKKAAAGSDKSQIKSNQRGTNASKNRNEGNSVKPSPPTPSSSLALTPKSSAKTPLGSDDNVRRSGRARKTKSALELLGIKIKKEKDDPYPGEVNMPEDPYPREETMLDTVGPLTPPDKIKTEQPQNGNKRGRKRKVVQAEIDDVESECRDPVNPTETSIEALPLIEQQCSIRRPSASDDLQDVIDAYQKKAICVVSEFKSKVKVESVSTVPDINECSESLEAKQMGEMLQCLPPKKCPPGVKFVAWLDPSKRTRKPCSKETIEELENSAKQEADKKNVVMINARDVARHERQEAFARLEESVEMMKAEADLEKQSKDRTEQMVSAVDNGGAVVNIKPDPDSEQDAEMETSKGENSELGFVLHIEEVDGLEDIDIEDQAVDTAGNESIQQEDANAASQISLVNGEVLMIDHEVPFIPAPTQDSKTVTVSLMPPVGMSPERVPAGTEMDGETQAAVSSVVVKTCPEQDESGPEEEAASMGSPPETNPSDDVTVPPAISPSASHTDPSTRHTDPSPSGSEDVTAADTPECQCVPDPPSVALQGQITADQLAGTVVTEVDPAEMPYEEMMIKLASEVVQQCEGMCDDQDLVYRIEYGEGKVTHIVLKKPEKPAETRPNKPRRPKGSKELRGKKPKAKPPKPSMPRTYKNLEVDPSQGGLKKPYHGVTYVSPGDSPDITQTTSEDIERFERHTGLTERGRRRPLKQAVVKAELKALVDKIEASENIDKHVVFIEGGSTKRSRHMQCRYCHMLLVDRHQFRKHIRSHPEVEYKPFKCPLCPYKSAIKAAVARHINIHSDVMPYVCVLCGRGFNFKQKLQTHMKYHNNIRDHKCPHCPNAFHETKTLNGHIRSIHGKQQALALLKQQSANERAEDADNSMVTTTTGEYTMTTSDVAMATSDVAMTTSDVAMTTSDVTMTSCAVAMTSSAVAMTSSVTEALPSMVALPVMESLPATTQSEGDVSVHGVLYDAQLSAENPDDGQVLQIVPGHLVQDQGAHQLMGDTLEQQPQVITAGEGFPADGQTGIVHIIAANDQEFHVQDLMMQPQDLGDPPVEEEPPAESSDDEGQQIMEVPVLEHKDSLKGIIEGHTTDEEDFTDFAQERPEVIRIQESKKWCKDPDGAPYEVMKTITAVSSHKPGATLVLPESSQPKIPSDTPSQVVLPKNLPKWGNPGQQVLVVDRSQPKRAKVTSKHLEDKIELSPRQGARKTARVTELYRQGITKFGASHKEIEANKPKNKPKAAKDPDPTEPEVASNPFTVVEIVPESEQPAEIQEATTADYVETTAAQEGPRTDQEEITANQEPTETASEPVCSMGQLNKSLSAVCSIRQTVLAFTGKKMMSYHCKLCEGVFTSKTLVVNHIESFHSDVKLWECPECDYTCRLRSSMFVHKKLHTGNKEHICKICGKTFVIYSKLRDHMTCHSEKLEYRCDTCGKQFRRKADLKKHENRMHVTDRPLKCPVCEKTFREKLQLKRHLETHVEGRPLQCDICKKRYKSKSSLHQHSKSHLCRFYCELCRKSFGSYSGFMAHKVMHTESFEGFHCDLCGKTLHTKGSLNRHLTISHSTARPFQCLLCKSSFKTKKDLRNHAIVHTTAKSYECPDCGFRSKRLESLQVHRRRHAEVKPYRCGVCGREYTQKRSLQMHLPYHMSELQVCCPFCDKRCVTKSAMDQHVRRHHQGAPDPAPAGPDKPAVTFFMCEECNSVFLTQDNLAVHILVEHMNQPRAAGELELTPDTDTSTVLKTDGDANEARTFVLVVDPKSRQKKVVSLAHPPDDDDERAENVEVEGEVYDHHLDDHGDLAGSTSVVTVTADNVSFSSAGLGLEAGEGSVVSFLDHTAAQDAFSVAMAQPALSNLLIPMETEVSIATDAGGATFVSGDSVPLSETMVIAEDDGEVVETTEYHGL